MNLFLGRVFERIRFLPFITHFLFFLAVVLFLNCTDGQTEEVSFWSVRVETSGGFIGVGRGSVFITSHGRIVAKPPNVSRQTKSTCVAGLTVEELRLISKAVYGSEPDQWKIEDPNFAAQDAFQYRLELRLEDKRSGKTYKVEWYDNTEEHMPEKLKVLYQEIEKVWERIVNSC